MICNRCNHKLPDDSEFCQYCGTKIEHQPLETISAEESSTKNELPNDSIDLQAKETNAKIKYCSHCGAVIDNATKQCTGCGKQYFKGIKINKVFIIVLLAVLLTLSVILNAMQLMSRNEIEDRNEKLSVEISELKSEIKSKESKISKLTLQVLTKKELELFVDNHVVFQEDDNTNRYHKWGCSKFKGKSFWVYNVGQASRFNASPCSICH